MPDIVGRLKTPRLPSAPSSPTVGEMYYNTTDNTLYFWNGTAWTSSSGGGGVDLVYNGQFPAGGPAYTDGDIVIGADNIAYICVKPTSAAPVSWTGIAGPVGPAGPQGAQGPQGVKGDTGAASPLVPAVQNGKWLNGSGGAAVWANITQPALPTPLQDKAVVAGDLNLAIASGWYGIDTTAGTTNAPFTYGVVQTLQLGPTTCRQVAYMHDSLDIWQRKMGSSVWSAWVQTQWTPDLTWRVVGASGQPAFQSGWTNWDPNGGRDIRFRKLATGLVLLAGIAKSPASIVNPIFTLPVGYRIKASTSSGPIDLYFGGGVCSTTPTTYQIMENGTVNIVGGLVNQWCDISGLSFFAEQ